MAVIKIAQQGTTERLNPNNNVPCYFVDNTGKRIAVVHGQENGAWPQESRSWLKKYEGRVDEIYCCYPRMMKRMTADLRIQGNHDHLTGVHFVRRTGGDLIVRIFETDLKE